MKYTYRVFSVIFLLFILASCKEKSNKNQENNSENNQGKEITTIIKPHIATPEDRKKAKSVLIKMMLMPETKLFVSAMVTAGLTDMLSKQDGPFTVLAPSNDAFEKKSEGGMDLLFANDNKEMLINLINNHIIEGKLDYLTLVQEVNNNRGNYKLTTLSGNSLAVSMNGNDIVIEDENGVKALLVKKDIKGSNGVIHILNSVFNVD